MLIKISPLFLLDKLADGGLGLTTLGFRFSFWYLWNYFSNFWRYYRRYSYFQIWIKKMSLAHGLSYEFT